MADWGVDYIKVDGCNFNPEQMGVAYPEFGRRLLETNRPIVYSANWAVSEYNVGIQVGSLSFLVIHSVSYILSFFPDKLLRSCL